MHDPRAGPPDPINVRHHDTVQQLTDEETGAPTVAELRRVPLARVAHAQELKVREASTVAYELVHLVREVGERHRREQARLRDLAAVVGIQVVYGMVRGSSERRAYKAAEAAVCVARHQLPNTGAGSAPPSASSSSSSAPSSSALSSSSEPSDTPTSSPNSPSS
jgi:hypothetical protein